MGAFKTKHWELTADLLGFLGQNEGFLNPLIDLGCNLR